MKKIVIHMGAHRCGSTAIQSMLRREREKLAQLGIGVSLREDMIKGGIDLRRLHRHQSFNPIWQIKLRKAADALLSMPHEILIMSEENVMGTMPSVRSNSFYPHFHRFMRGLEQLHSLTRGQVKIAPRLVVRRQDHFLESVYAFRVSRGFKRDFNHFVGGVTKKPRSWLYLAKQLENLPKPIDAKIAMLEAWPKGRSAGSALEFLIGEHDLEMSAARLTGNTRLSQKRLKFALALNKAGVLWRGKSWFEDIAAQVDATSSDESADLDFNADMELKSHVSRAELGRFRTYYAEDVTLGFSDDERENFLADYDEENEAFCALPMVMGSADLWRR